jgi:hypothetical protein
MKKSIASGLGLIGSLVFLAVSVHAEDTNNVGCTTLYIVTTNIPPGIISVSPNPSSPDYALQMHPHFSLYFNMYEYNRLRGIDYASTAITVSKPDSINFAGHNMLLTQGPVPVNFDAMDTPARQELRKEMYTRVELLGGGRTGGLFASEAEGTGIHAPTINKDPAVFLLKASKNNVGVALSGTFKDFPFH